MSSLDQSSSIPKPGVTPPDPSPRESVLAIFESFRETLDEQNDRYERLVKLSRDLTIQSKRIIFLLHRVAGQTAPFDSSKGTAGSLPIDARSTESHALEPARLAELEAARQGRDKFNSLKPLFSKIAAELKGQEVGRYSRAISPGLEEFLESLSFVHYLEHEALISYQDVSQFLGDQGIPISQADYLLGISDLSGELMRFAISAASMRGGRKQKVAEVCHFVRGCSAGFEPLVPYVRGLAKKQEVTNESLKKIEKAAYAIALRGAEYPDAELRGILIEPSNDRKPQARARNFDDGGDVEMDD